MIADVVSAGARGPLGLSRLQVAMCLRARKLEPQAVSFHDKRGQEIGVALTGGLGERSFGYSRLIALGAPALSEAVSGLGELRAPDKQHPLPLCVALPEKGRPDDAQSFETSLFRDLSERSGVPIDLERSTIVRKGQAGFADALLAAKKLLDGGAQVVGVGGMDSYYHPGVLEWLDRECRLHALGADGGFIPSEAAAFLMLARVPKSADRLGRILDAAVGEERTARSEEEPNIAACMTELLTDVQSRIGRQLEWAITDFNGERHRYKEWEKARRRALKHGSEDTNWVWDTGDVGAASGALFATILLTMWELGCAPAPAALVALHSNGTERGVVALEGVS